MTAFPSIRIEGGLLGPDILDQLLAADLPGQKPADFGLEARRNLTDEIAALFADARALWSLFQNRLARLREDDLATTVTRDAWVVPLLGLLGYELRYNSKAFDVDGLSFAISHRAGEAEDSPPIHIVGARQELGRVPPPPPPRGGRGGGSPRRSPPRARPGGRPAPPPRAGPASRLTRSSRNTSTAPSTSGDWSPTASPCACCATAPSSAGRPTSN